MFNNHTVSGLVCVYFPSVNRLSAVFVYTLKERKKNPSLSETVFTKKKKKEKKSLSVSMPFRDKHMIHAYTATAKPEQVALLMCFHRCGLCYILSRRHRGGREEEVCSRSDDRADRLQTPSHPTPRFALLVRLKRFLQRTLHAQTARCTNAVFTLLKLRILSQ